MEIDPINKLKDLMAGFSNRKFADRVGLSEKTVRNLLSGEQEFTANVSEKIATAFGLPATYFLDSDVAEVNKDRLLENPVALNAYYKYIDQLKGSLRHALERVGYVAESEGEYIVRPAGEEVRLVGQMPAGVNVDLMDELPAAWSEMKQNHS